MKTLPLTSAFLMAVVLGSFSSARAQWRLYRGGYNKAATAGESYARGMADIVRSQGAKNMLDSQAAINVETARSQNLDNRLKATQTYFQRRNINAEYRDANRKPPLTSEQLFRIAAEQAPARLSASELDPLTGEINWPTILRDKAYGDSRQKMEDLLAARVRKEGGSQKEVYDAGKEMQAELKDRLKDYMPDEYVQAKKFIDSLMYETRFVSG